MICDNNKDLVFKTMKSLQYIMKFIVKSRLLYTELYAEKDDHVFEITLGRLLSNIATMMCHTSDKLLREQGACLKYFPSTIPDILKIYSHKQLSLVLCDLLKNMPQNKLTKQKMMTINEIVHSPLFLYPECRQILLPVFTKQIKLLFEQNEEVKFIKDCFLLFLLLISFIINSLHIFPITICVFYVFLFVIFLLKCALFRHFGFICILHVFELYFLDTSASLFISVFNIFLKLFLLFYSPNNKILRVFFFQLNLKYFENRCI